MAFGFTDRDFKKLSKALGSPAKFKGTNVRFELGRKDSQRPLTLEIYPDIPIGKRRGNLVSVYTPSAHLQLHFCTGYIISDMLNEVTFIGEEDGKISGIIIEKEGACSLYANVDREILSGDFTQLGPEVMLSGIALSLTETILPEPKKRRPKKTSR
ncbi:MAG: hypothetical protein HY033_08125 [Ignavibacteriae bacterium]|nr:hypothetical protein [Ignavibacteria bacterium]MBI3364859.1 hypothetical protein [Ignavibacteriota bacterium]